MNKNLEKYFTRLSTQEKIIFAKRLAVLINAGVPILSGLKMLAKQAGSKAGKEIFQNIALGVEKGEGLSQNIKRYQNIFGEFFINMVRIGEATGNLQENLNYLAVELKKQQELKRKITGALVYPVFIVVATFGMTILLMVYVFPKILPVFKSLRVPLPWTTRTLIFTSNLLLHHGLLLFFILLVFIIAIVLLTRRLFFKIWLHRNILRLPLVGSLIQSYHLANFSRSLGLLLKSDIRIVEAINIITVTNNNHTYRSSFQQLTEGITRGESLSHNLNAVPKIFPPLLTQMVEVGETTGSLSDSLIYISEIYEDELNNLTKNLSSAIEPVLMVVMGILVGFIAISIITPIYGITQNLHP